MSEKVKRYECYVNKYSHAATLRERDKGEVVKYEDYARLAEENKKLKIKTEGTNSTLIDYLKIMKQQEIYITDLKNEIEDLKDTAIGLGGCCGSEDCE